MAIDNDPNKSTARYGTAVDVVFTGYLDNFMSKTFVTYFN